MSTYVSDDGVMDRDSTRRDPPSIATIETYETDDCVVFYDSENPLAWLECAKTVTLTDLA